MLTEWKILKEVSEKGRCTWDLQAPSGFTIKVSLRNAEERMVYEAAMARILDYLNASHQLPESPEQLFGGTGPRGAREWRPGQREIALLAVALNSMSSNNVYIDAPTGSGKSIIAMAIAHQYMGFDENWVPGDEMAVILTLDHALQRQYAEIPAVGSITGRRNWTCTADVTKTAEDAPCTTWMRAYDCEKNKQRLCPYFLQREQALEKPVVVTNYHYYLGASTGGDFLQPGILICDEGHEAERAVREFQAVSLRLDTVINPAERVRNRARGGLPHPHPTDFAGWRNLFNKQLVEARDTHSELFDQLHDTMRDFGEEDPMINQLTMKLARAQTLSRNLTKALSLLQVGGTPLIAVEDGRVTLTPLVGNLELLDPMHNGAVFLSATIINPTIADKFPHWFVEMPSTFPVENRPVKVLPGPKVSRKSSEQDYRKLAQDIDRILQLHSKEKGLVHTVSYDLADTIKSFSKFPGLLINHGSGERDRAIAAFRAAPNGRALLSPSVSAGLDLPYDACRWQAIAKLPFPNLGDPLAAARGKAHPELATLDTARTIVQMAGRGVRAVDDTCVTYIEDGNFKWFYRQNFEYFPKWFRDAVEFV